MRAQISIDFIIATLVAMSLFSVVFSLYITKNQGVGTVMSSLESQRIGEKLAWDINRVARGGDGASAEVIVPDRIWGEEYYIFIEGRWVEVVWNHGGTENHLSTPLMTNNTKGGLFDPGSRLRITNRGGVIEVS